MSSSPRRLVRRYHLGYGDTHVSLLTSVQLEGRCSTDEATAPAEGDDGTVAATQCSRMPAHEMTYGGLTSRDSDTVLAPWGLGAFSRVTKAVQDSPTVGLGDQQGLLLDINADGLVDVYHPDPGVYQGAHAVCFNESTGGPEPTRFGGATPMAVMPIEEPGAPYLDAFTLTPRDPNVVAMDFDSSSSVDLVYLPRLRQPAVFSPVLTASGWQWSGRLPKTSPQTLPLMELANPTWQGRARRLDANGDGLIDIVVTSATSLDTYFSLSGLPGGDGKFGHGVRTGPNSADLLSEPVKVCLPGSELPLSFTDSAVRLADMNADGLVDIVNVKRNYIEYWPGRGDGRWGDGDLERCRPGKVQAAPSIVVSSVPLTTADIGKAELADVSGDGLPDLVLPQGDGTISIWLNVDGRGWSPEVTISRAVPAFWNAPLRIADIDGSGTPDLVWAAAGAYRYLDILGGKRPNVLRSISNGLGKTTEFEYVPSTREMQRAAQAGHPWTSRVPVVVPVVKRVTVSDNLASIGRASTGSVTEYEYADPVYDGRAREFRGFRTVNTVAIGDSSSPSHTTRSRFLLGECVDGAVNGRCSPDARSTPNPQEALKGLPATTDVFATDSGAPISTAHTTYGLRRLYVGEDGQEVYHAFVKRTDKYLYDPSSSVASSSVVWLPEVEEELSPGTVAHTASAAIELLSEAGRARTATASFIDVFGHPTKLVSYGCIEGCPAQDETITAHSRFERVAGDGSGWLWRQVESYVTGDSQEKRDHLYSEYDGLGRPTRTMAELKGTLALDRRHQTAGAAIAPAPAASSADGVVVQAIIGYDMFGNRTLQQGPNHRCRTSRYDDLYAELVTGGSVFVGADSGGCGAREVAQSVSFDRGLRAPVTSIGPNGETARNEYDEFGRLVRHYGPDPRSPGLTAPWADAEYEYFTTTDWRVRPFSIVHVRARDDRGDGSSVSYHESYGYMDGLGRTLVTLMEADPSRGDLGAWVASGTSDYSAKGLPIRTYKPWFWSGNPLAFPLSGTPSTPFSQRVYDAFGRPIVDYAPDGGILLQRVYHALQNESWDANDLKGPFQGTFSSVRQDGHGRYVEQVERTSEGGTIRPVITATDYLPTNEPYRVTRSTNGSAPVIRWLRYDSLGRMVLNVEPNTSTAFTTNVQAAASQVKAWRYAYNDNGELVGTSDARGCGTNYFHDAGGRILAEDYSPCLAGQDRYTPPNLTTGDGTEAFFTYDTADWDAASAVESCVGGAFLVGKLASVASRGSKSVADYDGRGRITCEMRRLSKPGTPDSRLANRFAERWYAKTRELDAGGRVARESTGARVPENLGQSRESFTVPLYSARGIVYGLGSSYGNLVASTIVDANGLR
ncbi:MAG: FG-GAP-like repeat-containing protein, partial [Polyangiaceae bacterium]|nr:FG-GAP-like repeat-containing protein [Polyangiaceae bacterium]